LPACAAALGLALVLPAQASADVIRGTGAADRLRGTRGNDVIYGLGGGDRIWSRYGGRDVVRCGTGRDWVYAGREDVLIGCEHRPVFRVNRPWVCRGRKNVPLVKINMRRELSHGIYLRENCSGRIGRIEINTWTGDGVTINRPEPVAHDLVIGGGYIRCHANVGGHQDGVQAMSGRRITFRNLEINCNSRPNSQFYPSASPGGMPVDVLCVRCFLGSGAASTLFIDDSIRSGARNTRICPGRYHTVRIERGARSPVRSGNTILRRSHRLCR
jgi:Ca2+-binding RTX toxin-like protein